MRQFPPSPKTTHGRPSSVLPCRFPAAGARIRFQNKTYGYPATTLNMNNSEFNWTMAFTQPPPQTGTSHGYPATTKAGPNHGYPATTQYIEIWPWLFSHHQPEPTHASPPWCSSSPLSFHRPAAQSTPGRWQKAPLEQPHSAGSSSPP